MPQNEFKLPADIQQILDALRARIRRYVLIEGTATVLIVLAALFWGSLAVDFVYFKISHLELPQWFRAGFDILAISLLALTLMTWIVLRLVRQFRYRALALLLERRFPELDDRLITAVELSESISGDESSLSRAMIQRTVSQVTRDAKKLTMEDVFEKAPLRKAVVLASVLVVSVAGLAVANQDAFNRWKAGYLELEDVYWERNFGLHVEVVAQPGDVVKQFAETESGLQYKHPRGGDLTLLITVPDGKQLPDQVELSYRMANGRGRGSALCSKVEDGRFRYSVGGLLDDMEFWVTGGDFTNRRPYKVRIVDPPRVDEIVLECFYPKYTKLETSDGNSNAEFRDRVLVQGTQVSLPNETEFLMRVRCNKTLVGARIMFDPYEVSLAIDESGNFQATRTLKSDEGSREETVELTTGSAATLFSAERNEFVVPFVLSEAASDAAAARIEKLATEFGKPTVVQPDVPIRVFLEDTDDIIGSEPARLTINGIVDEPPRIATRLRGIGTSITRKARIPVTGTIHDDYGIVNARFEFQIDKKGDWLPREFESAPDGMPKTFTLARSEEQGFEQFGVVTMGLANGQKLTIQVYAEDGDTLNGPHSTRGERYTFTIVSNEELLSILHQRELNLRRRFEQIISELKDSRKDVLLHRTRLQEMARLQKATDESDAEKKIREIEIAVIACAERSLHGLRKNENETTAISESFGDIREELVNNDVATPLMLERIDDRIVNPLRAITSNDYPRVDEALGLFKFANDNGQDPTEAIDESAELLSELIESMERILLEMRKLESFQEIVELLKAIQESEQKLLEKTKSEQKKELFKRLGLDDE